MEIGGYFNLELKNSNRATVGSGFLKLNSGRHALEYILRGMPGMKKIHIPYFTCDVVLEPIHKLQIPYQNYTINHDLEIDWTTLKVGEGEAVLYTNYFGIKDEYVNNTLSKHNIPIIIDNAQSMFSQPVPSFPSFYSPRKFVGIADGGWLYLPPMSLNKDLYYTLDLDVSWDRCSHLLKRLELEAKEGYADFKENSLKLKNGPIKKMSLLTQRLIESIDFQEVRKRRLENYLFLDNELKGFNELKIKISEAAVPLVYPLLLPEERRSTLIENNIFVATYWPNVLEWCGINDFEYYLSKNLLPLPIDQRYGRNEMQYIVDVLDLHK